MTYNNNYMHPKFSMTCNILKSTKVILYVLPKKLNIDGGSRIKLFIEVNRDFFSLLFA